MMSRRFMLTGSAAAVALGASASDVWARAMTPLKEVARAIQSRPYKPNNTPLSAPFAGLDYDKFRAIRPIVGKTAVLPHGDRFAVDLLPPGLYFPDPVRVDRVTQAGLSEIAFSPKLFTFDERYFDDIPDTSPGAGFTGMRLRYPLNKPDVLDEVLVMQGGSYFRAIGEAMAYGLSARTVAKGTGGGGPEEFPRFVHLRLHEADGDSVRVEGVIDGPSLTGHLDMVLSPGKDTRMDVVTTLFPRVDIDDIGIAPLTSMYLKGPMLAAVSDDFRPRVHDSDVLMIRNGSGEHLWRPIANPKQVETSSFVDKSPKGYGLYQTRRDYESFQDSEARYHDRPSAYVEPKGDWGAGNVMLVELPTGDEFLDNIVAFWRPEAPLQAGAEYSYAYGLNWTRTPPDIGELPAFTQGRSGREHDRPGHRRFVIDVNVVAQEPQALVSATQGARISGVSAFALPGRDVTRVTFLFSPGPLQSAEIRMNLLGREGAPLSPVWLHRWTPARDGGV